MAPQKEWAFLFYALRFTAYDGRYASGAGICQLNEPREERS